MKTIIRIAVAIAIVATLGAVPGSAQDQQVRRSQLGDHFLELDGAKVGFLHTVDGGEITADPISEASGPGYFVKKHIGQPKYTEFDVQIGLAMRPVIYNWIEDSWKLNFSRKDGSIHLLDPNMKAVSQREFFNALITETTIPACDGESKEVQYIKLKFKPELTRTKPASGNVASFATAEYAARRLIASNFKLTIDGVDCTRVSKIDSFTIKQPVISDDIGNPRDQLPQVGKIDFPNLKITLQESADQGFKDWFDDFVLKGHNGEENEKNGVLEFLSPNRERTLLKINFHGLGIFKMIRDEVSPKNCDCELCQTVVAGANSADHRHHVTVHLYCERMEFHWQAPPDSD